MTTPTLRENRPTFAELADRHWMASWFMTVGAIGAAAEPLLVLARRAAGAVDSALSIFALGGLVLLILLLGWLAARLTSAAVRWLPVSRERARVTGLIVCAIGAGPWLAPVVFMMPLAHPWNLDQAAWVLNTAIWPLAAFAAVPRARVRIGAVAATAALAIVWTPMQHYLIAAHEPHIVASIGHPPLTELRAVDWSDMVAGKYTYSGGRVLLDYDQSGFALMGEFAGLLIIAPASQASACTMYISDISNAASLSNCHRQANGEWYLTDSAGDCRNGCAAAIETDGYLVEVYETESSQSPSDDPRTVLLTQHQVSDTDLYYLMA